MRPSTVSTTNGTSPNSVNTFNSLADLLQYQYIENVKSNSKKEPRVVEAVEPDPFGIYIRPRCTEDVAVIVNLLVRKAIARELGDILVLQAHAESYWHGAAGCFPAWQPVEEAEDR